MAKGSGVPPFPVNEDQVSEVDDEPGGLADDENGVFAEDRIDQQKRPPMTLKIQNERGTTLRPARSLAIHWTRKRAENIP